MDKPQIDDLRDRVLRGDDISVEELRAALAAMCSRPPIVTKDKTPQVAIEFDARGFLQKRLAAKAPAPPGEGGT
jgi:hypothetical protein